LKVPVQHRSASRTKILCRKGFGIRHERQRVAQRRGEQRSGKQRGREGLGEPRRLEWRAAGGEGSCDGNRWCLVGREGGTAANQKRSSEKSSSADAAPGTDDPPCVWSWAYVGHRLSILRPPLRETASASANLERGTREMRHIFSLTLDRGPVHVNITSKCGLIMSGTCAARRLRRDRANRRAPAPIRGH
jgi:hypothetical protein